MRILKPIYILLKSKLKDELGSKYFYTVSITTPFVYTAIFIFQAMITYQVNPNAFQNLSKEGFFVCIFAGQLVFYLKSISAYDSLALLSRSVKTSELDVILLRPLNLFYYKYFHLFSASTFVLIPFALTAFFYCAILANLSTLIILKIFLFIILATVLYINVMAVIFGMIFYTRSTRAFEDIYESLFDMADKKPKEIFPYIMQISLIYIVPVLIISSFVFDLIRSRDDFLFWGTIFIWVAISAVANNLVWKIGLKKYESIG
jgi:ABC-type uncharacterized transport system permease subunit